MKSLKIIQTLANVARIICIVIFVLCIVGASLCVASLIALPFVKDIVVETESGKTIEVIFVENDIPFNEAMFGLGVGLLSCGVGIFLAKYTEHFFDEEIKLGTPFDDSIVKKMRKVAIVHIIASIVTSAVAGIAYMIVKALTEGYGEFSFRGLGGSIGFALALLVLSLFCEYGAELKKEQQPQAEEEKSE